MTADTKPVRFQLELAPKDARCEVHGVPLGDKLPCVHDVETDRWYCSRLCLAGLLQ